MMAFDYRRIQFSRKLDMPVGSLVVNSGCN